MTDRRRVIRYLAAAAGVVALLAGCRLGGGAASNTSSPTESLAPAMAPDAPTAFNGCRLKRSVIASAHLDPYPIPADATDASDGAVWRGCVYSTFNGDGYGTSIRTTNLTIPMIEVNRKFNVAAHLTVDGRQAIIYHESAMTASRSDCLLNVAMAGGGLEILVTNPSSHKATGTQDSCVIAENLAGQVVNTFPATA